MNKNLKKRRSVVYENNNMIADKILSELNKNINQNNKTDEEEDIAKNKKFKCPNVVYEKKTDKSLSFRYIYQIGKN